MCCPRNLNTRTLTHTLTPRLMPTLALFLHNTHARHQTPTGSRTMHSFSSWCPLSARRWGGEKTGGIQCPGSAVRKNMFTFQHCLLLPSLPPPMSADAADGVTGPHHVRRLPTTATASGSVALSAASSPPSFLSSSPPPFLLLSRAGGLVKKQMQKTVPVNNNNK